MKKDTQNPKKRIVTVKEKKNLEVCEVKTQAHNKSKATINSRTQTRLESVGAMFPFYQRGTEFSTSLLVSQLASFNSKIPKSLSTKVMGENSQSLRL